MFCISYTKFIYDYAPLNIGEVIRHFTCYSPIKACSSPDDRDGVRKFRGLGLK